MFNIKYSTLIVLFISSAFIFSSCDNASTSTSPPSETESFIKTGKYHNQALDYLYQKVSSLSPDKVLGSQAFNSNSLKKRLKTYINEYAESENITDYNHEVIEAGFKIGTRGDYQPTGPTAGFKKASYDSIYQTLSNTQQKLLSKTISVVHEIDDLQKLKNKLLKINHQANQQLSKKQARIIYVSTSVAYYSSKYWTNNWDKWRQLFDSKTGAQNIRIAANADGGIVESDVMGAATGAALSAWTGCAYVTLGWCAAGGAVIGGAVASAADAIM